MNNSLGKVVGVSYSVSADSDRDTLALSPPKVRKIVPKTDVLLVVLPWRDILPGATAGMTLTSSLLQSSAHEHLSHLQVQGHPGR